MAKAWRLSRGRQIYFQGDLRSQFAKRVSLVLLGSAEWDGAPRETDSTFSTSRARRAAPATGLGRRRDPEGAPPGRFGAVRARRGRDRPGGRGEKTRRLAKKSQFYFVIIFRYVGNDPICFDTFDCGMFDFDLSEFTTPATVPPCTLPSRYAHVTSHSPFPLAAYHSQRISKHRWVINRKTKRSLHFRP